MTVQPFVDKSDDGNERAFRRGRSVPREGLPLSYFKAPRLSPEKNVLIVDTSHAIDDMAEIGRDREIYYADPLGILVDGDNNAVVQDDQPYVTDIFSLEEEDPKRVDPHEYNSKTMLPYLHVSRHFHLDFAGLTIGDDLITYRTSAIKVVTEDGEEYVDPSGRPRYKIKIAPASIQEGPKDSNMASPMELGSLVGWWSALEIDDKDDEAKVSSWVDSSGLDVELKQDDEDKQPVWKMAGVDQGFTMPSVRFDGDQVLYNDDEDRWARLHDGQDHTIVVVAKNHGTNASRVISSLSSFSNGPGTAITYASNGSEIRRVINNDDGHVVDDDLAHGDDDKFVIVTSVVKGSSHALHANDNETESSFSSDELIDEVPSAGGLFVGAQNENTTSGLEGDIAEIIIFDRALDEDQQHRLNKWVEAKYYGLDNFSEPEPQDEERDSWAYRVHAYIDKSDVRHLRLKYNKVELGSDGVLRNAQPDYEERLNVSGFYEFRPEESEVVDPDNRKERIYSTKPVKQKERLLGRPGMDKDGYKIFVPKKAVGDPRIFQIFRWRIRCDFTKTHEVDVSRRAGVVKCGVLATNEDFAKSTPTDAPYAFINLQKSSFNITNIDFRNPLNNSHTDSDKAERDYWLVNLDEDDLSQFDLLIWCPPSGYHNYNKYAAKLESFMRDHGGTVFVDAPRAQTDDDDIFSDVDRVRASGTLTSSEEVNVVEGDQIDWADDAPEQLIDGEERMGGWDLSGNLADGETPVPQQVSFRQIGDGPQATRWFSHTDTYSPILEGPTTQDGSIETVTAIREVGSGSKIRSMLGHLPTCSRIYSHIDNSLVDENTGASMSMPDNYNSYINSFAVEGAMKFLFNVALFAVKGRLLASGEDDEFSSVWTHYTPWQGSWVIDGTRELLNESEREEHNFHLEPKDLTKDPPDDTPIWKRRLSGRTYEELMDEELQDLIAGNPEVKNYYEGARREYTLEITNDKVKTEKYAWHNNYPWAWTTAWSPKFTVPPDIGPFVMRYERDEDGQRGVEIDWDEYRHTEKIFPERPYSGYVKLSYMESEVSGVTQTVNWSASGTADETYEYEKEIEEEYEEEKEVERDEEKEKRIDLTWYDFPKGGSREYEHLDDNNADDTPWRWMRRPRVIRTWQEKNYHTSNWGPGHKCFPHYGHYSRVTQGDRGDNVKFIQEALNRFYEARSVNDTPYFTPSTGLLTVDGIYGPKTATAVQDFQSQMNARWVDGAVDAETWSIIGGQILRASGGAYQRVVKDSDTSSNWTGWFLEPAKWMEWRNISDGQRDRVWAKRSWRHDGPSLIWDLVQIVFDRKYTLYGVTVVPYVAGDTSTIKVRSVDVRTQPFDLRNYDSHDGLLTELPNRPSDGEEEFIPLDDVKGDTIIVGVGQDGPVGHGTARMFGIRDIIAHAKVSKTVTIDDTKTETKTRTHTETRLGERGMSFSDSGTIDVEPFTDVTFYADPPSPREDTVDISNVRWNSVSVDNEKVNASISRDGKITLSTQVLDIEGEDASVKGPEFPGDDPDYYTRDVAGRVDPLKATGYVSAQDGVRLLCDREGRPWGFPDVSVGGNTKEQNHYMKLTLNDTGNDSDVELDFYDINEQEFVVSDDGKSEMTYLNYMARGPHNVYIAVSTDYKQKKEKSVPNDNDAPRLPIRWAYPVYGVDSRRGSRIRLEPLPRGLGARDLWPISVRDGRFTRSLKLPNRSSSTNLPSYLKDYQGSEVFAVYALPEAKTGGFSRLYGPPNIDVKNESPRTVSDYKIQVRQAPIMMLRQPTAFPSHADPSRPVIEVKVYDDWDDSEPETLTWKDFADWDAERGEVFLKRPLPHIDERLIRVDYTSTDRRYRINWYDEERVNLNPISSSFIEQKTFDGSGFYVYILPYYMRDREGNIVEGSERDSTLRLTTSSGIFDPFDPDYDPTAVMLGAVYSIQMQDPNDIAMLDARPRGGGVRRNVNIDELNRVTSDAMSYWDLSAYSGQPYPKSGFIIVRLPEELNERFDTREIREVIDRNIVAGVDFKIETLEGEDWEEKFEESNS